MPLLELNLLLNFGSQDASEASSTTGRPSGGDIRAMALPWGEPVSPEVVARVGGLPVDCLLLCDVVYEPHLFPLLLTTLAELSGPETLILLAYRRRNPDECKHTKSTPTRLNRALLREQRVHVCGSRAILREAGQRWLLGGAPALA